ncbi:NADH-quinone oxidoreductase subunit J [Candidatus Symbiobacter mobilis]|uniref:NADH-quinone oxidoreductase subunit J n=1 Tax=Candidatus Symbiobacter mobilis CR TaxID=946483 RepID=U5N8X6_9BURK|nr:NADH-quinone oxidoreductase subunit J [Candidatus Symbiobacter mobilis]AGX87780.1 NADH dehydrogenase I subunit J [Candidatus Symbiobacter mobilis CR]
MDFQFVLFALFSAIALLAALGVVTVRNPVHAVLLLVLTFFQTAMIWMLLQAEFLAIALVLVYVGAVMVLLLFVVMMLDVRPQELRGSLRKHLPVAALIGTLIVMEMSAVLMGGFATAEGSSAIGAGAAADVDNTKALGEWLYSEYLYPLEVAAAILLVAMIAAIFLTLRTRKDSKAVHPHDQVQVRAEDRMTLVAMPVQGKQTPSAPSTNPPAESAQ